MVNKNCWKTARPMLGRVGNKKDIQDAVTTFINDVMKGIKDGGYLKHSSP